MVQEILTKLIEFKSETAKTRTPCELKRFTSDGKSIPLKGNWSEMWCTLPIYTESSLKELLNLKLANGDVFVVTFMKSGTTWVQETAWLLLNNLDFEKAKETCVTRRSSYLDSQVLGPSACTPLEKYKPLSSPRLLKIHMPANLLPIEIWEKKLKTIYVARNVKDVIVSSYHFIKSLKLWKGNSFPEYVEDFINGEIIYTNYWAHVINFWLLRNEPFIFFVTYEEMQKDLANVLQRLCTFLERPQLTEEELRKTVEFLSFNTMKENSNDKLCNVIREVMPDVKDDLLFMRRGIVGSFKDELTPDLIAKIDKWTNDFLGKYGIKEEDIFGKV